MVVPCSIFSLTLIVSLVGSLANTCNVKLTTNLDIDISENIKINV